MNTVPEILELLNHKNDHVRDGARYLLVELGAKEALPEVLKYVKESKRSFAALVLLTELDPRESVKELLNQLNDPKFKIDIFTSGWLEEARTKEEVVPDMVKLLASDKPERRQLAL